MCTLPGNHWNHAEIVVCCSSPQLIGSSQLVQHPETRQNVVGTVISESQVACPLPTDCLLDEGSYFLLLVLFCTDKLSLKTLNSWS